MASSINTETFKKTGRPPKSDAQKQETKDKNKLKQAKDFLEKNQLYREMGLDCIILIKKKCFTKRMGS